MNLTCFVQPTAGAFALVALSVAATPEAWPQDQPHDQTSPVQAVNGSVQQIVLTLGKGEVFKTSTPYAKISVGDEKIVEVTPQSDREFIFTPRGLGTTNVFVLDGKSTLIATLEINVVGTAGKIGLGYQETYEESPGRVRVYNDAKSLTGFLSYRCIRTNCELVDEAPNAAPPKRVTPENAK